MNLVTFVRDLLPDASNAYARNTLVPGTGVTVAVQLVQPLLVIASVHAPLSNCCFTLATRTLSFALPLTVTSVTLLVTRCNAAGERTATVGLITSGTTWTTMEVVPLCPRE